MFKMNNKGTVIDAIGNVLVWYNFALFMPFLHILSKEFFPPESSLYSDILSFLTLSIGLFVRPFGAIVFGPIGDKLGRQNAISISVLLMAIATLCIGILPNYNQIGIWAPILLIFFRSLQGISLGGEYTASMVHLVECAPVGKRGFYGSWSDAGCQAGVVLGGQSLILLYQVFADYEIYSFAWRIPFLFSVALIPFAFFVTDDVSLKKSKPMDSILKMLSIHKKEIVCTAAITAFSAVGFYTLFTFLPYYLTESRVLTLKETTTCSVYSALITTISILVSGYLSDRFNKRIIMIIGIAGVFIVSYFMFMLSTVSFFCWMLLQLMYGLFLGIYYSCRAAFFSESFPSQIRCTAVSISISMSQAIFGGLTPIIMNYFTKHSRFLSVIPITFVTILAIDSLFVLKKRKNVQNG